MTDFEGAKFNPAEPGNETIIRAINSHPTPYAGEPEIEPPRWYVGDDLGEFEIEDSIGSGVTSSVYRVREKATGRKFAMKILRTRCEEMLTASRVGFRRIQKLSHPSLVRCDRMLMVDENLAFTMEEVVGKRLIDVISEARSNDRAVTYELAIQLLYDIGGALQAIHSAGLVHRDVKPDNVMIDLHGRARLIDYGLVGSYDPVSDPDAKRGYLAGTYWYMAPESITKQIYPPACDVYSLGCMLLELIADRNRLPSVTKGSSLGQALGSVRSYLPLDTPEELADLICDMVDPAPENRPLACRLVQVKRHSEPTERAPSNFAACQIHGRAKELEIAKNWIHSVIDGKPKRLHISGDSGVGKTWFLQEILQMIRSKVWFQVFDSTCRERAGVPLHAFDAMADAIARRYTRDDRDKLRLAPRHAAVLRQAFPSLRSVIIEPHFLAEEVQSFRRTSSAANRSSDKAPNAVEIARADALLAGVELVDRMCEYGPVFLIVDDIQWADADSINVLDKVLGNANGNTGIITVSRSKKDNFREPADCSIELQPLTESDAIVLLRQLLCNREYQWSDLALRRLAELSEGNALCITQLAACVGHDEASNWHDRLISTDVNIEDIWRSRIDQLSDVAKIAIQFLAVAGGPVLRSELAPVCALREQCEVALQELIKVGLVYDTAPKNDAVKIVHQRVARSIVKDIDQTRYRSLHHAWAVHLVQGEDVPWRAARIAGHLLDADETEAAVPYIIQAAQDAEARFAFTEAARWHHRAASQLTGIDSATHWIKSVQCFEEAGCPREAVDACRMLLLHPDVSRVNWTETTVRQHLAENLFRSGDIVDAVHVVKSIAAQFDSELGHFSTAAGRERIRQAFRSGLRLTSNNAQESGVTSAESPSAESDVAQVDLRCTAIDACIALYKPLFVFDIGLALSLLVKILAALPEAKCKTTTPVIFWDALVYGCRNNGPRRQRCTNLLNRAVEDSEETGNAAMVAQANCAIAFRHLAACDWASTISPSLKSVAAFQSQRQRNRFGEALARLPMNWSCVWLGRFRDLRSNVLAMTCDANERNDQSVAHLVHLGLGFAVNLMDDTDPPQEQERQATASSSLWMEELNGFSRLMKWQYEGEIERAVRYRRDHDSGQWKTLFKHSQLLRVLDLQFEGAIHIGNTFQRSANRTASLSIVKRVCQDLHNERIGYANAIGRYLQAQVLEVSGDLEQSAEMYVQAAGIADSLGLVPLKLAAIDRSKIVLGNNQSSELEDFLASEGIKVPGKFARLYCGLR